MGTELQTLDNELDNIVTAFDSNDEAAIMELTGQADTTASSNKNSLSRLAINYQEETDDGEQLKKGTWRIWDGTSNVYADKVYIRALMRTFSWSIWDQEEKEFSSQSVERVKLQGDFPDSTGGNKCGRLSKQEEELLSQDDPRLLLSKSVNCNQVIYGVIDIPEATRPDGSTAKVENMPFKAFFKRSGFIPVRNFIDQELTRKKKMLMPKAYIELTTDKQKSGGVIYWTPKLSLVKEVSITDGDKELIKAFADTVKGYNEQIMSDHRESLKSSMSESDVDLSQRFA